MEATDSVNLFLHTKAAKWIWWWWCFQCVL